MSVCWFATFHNVTQPASRLDEGDAAWLNRIIATTPGLERGLIFTPAHTHDPYLHDGAPPVLALQLYFSDILELEAGLTPTGHLQALAAPGALASLGDVDATQQAMLVRRYPVPEADFRTPPGEMPCTYLVAYEGEAEDLHAWLTHYMADHPPIMAQFPAIRQIELYTCIDWCGALPWRRVTHMQRNKVVFDSQDALTAALNSPVRHQMRASFGTFPPFTGPVTHFPMATATVEPGVPCR